MIRVGQLRMRAVGVALLVLAGLVSSDANARSMGLGEPLEVVADCGRSLQSIVDGAAVGATVLLPACVYRETVTISKPLTLAGQPGTEIRGSDIWANWRFTGSTWVSQQVLPAFPVVAVDPFACEPGSGDRCLRPEQVFSDGRALEPVGYLTNVEPGQFGLDGIGHVVLGDNPSGHLIEVSLRPRWIVSGSDYVTVRGLTMRHAANPATAGAISNDGHSNWTLQDSVLSGAHSADVSLDGGSHLQVVRNDIGYAGLVGLSGSSVPAGGLIRGNHIHDNRSLSASFNRNWGAGGLKLTLVQDFIVDNNEADHNDGVGLWCDIGCSNVTFSNNRVHHNQWQGINFEISNGASIHDNALWENGWGKAAWGWGAGIVISSSANAEVFANTAAWNYAGISVIWQNRPESPGPDPTGNYVHDNVIVKKTVVGDFSETYWQNLTLAWLSDGSAPMFDRGMNNRGLDNSVWYDRREDQTVRFSWSDQYLRLGQFLDTAGGQGTRYLTAEAKDQALANANVPLSPET